MTEFKGGTKETSSVGNPNPEGLNIFLLKKYILTIKF